jgi:hypothetical protein
MKDKKGHEGPSAPKMGCGFVAFFVLEWGEWDKNDVGMVGLNR